MSVDINWDTITGGADGSVRAEKIRAFIHDRFQQVTLPRFIRSVHVHSFDFGNVPPVIEIKDICDPLPDFYEEDAECSDEEQDVNGADEPHDATNEHSRYSSKDRHTRDASRDPPQTDHRTSRQPSVTPSYINTRPTVFRHPTDQLGAHLFPRVSTPGIPGGTSNLNYFHLPLGAGLSGATTPLAAVAGAQIQGWLENPHGWPTTPTNKRLHQTASMNSLTLTPQSNPDPSPRPSSQHKHDEERMSPLAESNDSSSQHNYERTPSPAPACMREKSPEDLQVVTHVQYSGDIKMSLTAEILLDYPMPSFVGIPLKLNITGLTFDGVAILAYIKKRAHFCFLSPDDADALVGRETLQGSDLASRLKVGGLLENIKVESEIGGQGSGKQVLKNVGKVESFVLEQVRRIFEDEFVYPSFWTFLV
ncbi:mitochondrial distribution and morphology protein 12 [Boeremia exigua]|uniref:mitochondrial distribution and morphology protein 12 n=1 Tax=Boeremia exigua TaxID=749465 RepID=UPI001E8D77F6|nr:mitochondrial distribution and morphology protein 12 [Boeremia exigua]KAH6643059.1 mitochondrial distribution and morphology protein 12 [Boeremia exigua]